MSIVEIVRKFTHVFGFHKNLQGTRPSIKTCKGCLTKTIREFKITNFKKCDWCPAIAQIKFRDSFGQTGIICEKCAYMEDPHIFVEVEKID